MSSAGAIKAGRAFIEIFADRSKLVADLNQAAADVKGFGMKVGAVGAGIAAAGAAIVGPILAASKVFADYGSKLSDASARTGIAASALSELQYAAEQTGTDLETVASASQRLSRVIAEAAGGSKSAAEALDAVGLSVDELLALSPDQQFMKVTEAISGLGSQSAKTNAAFELLGKSGTKLLGVTQELRDKAKDLAITMSDEDAAAADALGDSMDTLGTVIQSVTLAVGSALAPALTSLADRAVGVVKEVSTFIKENREIVVVTAAVGAALVVLGSTLGAVGTALTATAFAVGGLAAAYTAIIPAATAAWIAITGPVGLAVAATAAVAALGAAVLYLSGALDGSLASIGDAVSVLSDAFMSGNLQMAAAAAMLGVRLAVAKGLRDIQNDIRTSGLIGFLGPAGWALPFAGSSDAEIAVMEAAMKAMGMAAAAARGGPGVPKFDIGMFGPGAAGLKDLIGKAAVDEMLAIPNDGVFIKHKIRSVGGGPGLGEVVGPQFQPVTSSMSVGAGGTFSANEARGMFGGKSLEAGMRSNREAQLMGHNLLKDIIRILEQRDKNARGLRVGN